MKNLLTLLRPTSPEQQALKDVQKGIATMGVKSWPPEYLLVSHTITPTGIKSTAPLRRDHGKEKVNQ